MRSVEDEQRVIHWNAFNSKTYNDFYILWYSLLYVATHIEVLKCLKLSPTIGSMK